MEASIAGLWKTKSSSPFEIVGPLTALLIVNLAIRGHDIQKGMTKLNIQIAL
jgi:hypothetical protein